MYFFSFSTVVLRFFNLLSFLSNFSFYKLYFFLLWQIPLFMKCPNYILVLDLKKKNLILILTIFTNFNRIKFNIISRLNANYLHDYYFSKYYKNFRNCAYDYSHYNFSRRT